MCKCAVLAVRLLASSIRSRGRSMEKIITVVVVSALGWPKTRDLHFWAILLETLDHLDGK